MSAFYDQASLVVVPSGYKSGKIYAQKPLTTDGQLTFTRASTATRVNASGLIESVASGVPRLDYLGSSCPKLLLEPQRSNRNTNSQDASAWGQNNTPVVTVNDGISPDGTQNADKVVVNQLAEGFFNFSGGNVTSGTTHTISIFIKYISGATNLFYGPAGLGFGGDNTNTFNIQNGTVVIQASGNTASVQSYGNGWYRLIVTKTATANDLGGFILYGTGSDEVQYLVWGAQIEEGAYATSYIPTLGTSVTRVADAASKTGISSLIGQTEGTLFIELDIIAGSPVYHTLMQVYGDSDNRIAIGQDLNSTNVFMYINASGSASYQVATTPAGHYKIALAYKSGDVKLYINGTAAITSTRTITLATSLSTLFLNNVNGDEIGIFKDYQNLLFKTALTPAQLAELTTL
jgi:hypothetical protein